MAPGGGSGSLPGRVVPLLPGSLVSVGQTFGDCSPADQNGSQAARREVGAQSQGVEPAKPQQAPGADASGRSRQESVHEALRATLAQNRVQAEQFEAAKARREEIREWIDTGHPRGELLRDSVFARAQARLKSQPVIEQAKGILMAQQGCGPEEAFDLLRRASQRANIKVSVLAAQLVEQVTSRPVGNGALPARPLPPDTSARLRTPGS
jgi:hypothetical protein